VPTNSILTIHNQTVMVHPIIDEYYDRSPYHIRSSAFVQTKGLTSNEKAPRLLSSTSYSAPDLQSQKMPIGPTIPFNLSISRSPDRSSVVPKSKSPNAYQEGTFSLDIRPTVAPERAPSPNPPSQGNIKKKRMSLNALDQAHTTIEPDAESLNSTEPPIRPEYGNPTKIARFFPELTLS
jgi:glutamine amidotransferase